MSCVEVRRHQGCGCEELFIKPPTCSQPELPACTSFYNNTASLQLPLSGVSNKKQKKNSLSLFSVAPFQIFGHHDPILPFSPLCKNIHLSALHQMLFQPPPHLSHHHLDLLEFISTSEHPVPRHNEICEGWATAQSTLDAVGIVLGITFLLTQLRVMLL